MIIIIGSVIVIVSVLGGFMMAGGHPGALIQPAEFVVICGSAGGALIILSPKKVLVDMMKQIVLSPHIRERIKAYLKGKDILSAKTIK